jgi:hypothetical protein
MDHIYMRLAKETYDLTDDMIRRIVYNEYKIGFSRKLLVLQNSFNIMLGDDHDIADESLREKYDRRRTERIIRIFGGVFNEIGNGLRLTQSDVIHYGESSFLLIDNIRILTPHNYMRNVVDILGRNIYRKHLYIMSPRVMMNDTIPSLYKRIYSSEDNVVDYRTLYNMLFSLKSHIHILCGDAHTAKRFEISRPGSAKIIDLLFVGTMNSALDPYDGGEYLRGFNTNLIDGRVEHSHIVLRSGRLSHVFTDSCLNKHFGTCIYAMKYLCV